MATERERKATLTENMGEEMELLDNLSVTDDKIGRRTSISQGRKSGMGEGGEDE